MRFPAVTYALIAVNAGIFLWLWLSRLEQQSVINAVGLIPSAPSISSILTSMFSHSDMAHLIWNMFFLWLFGPNVEDVLGRLEYTIFYFGSGFAAALLHILVVRTLIPEAATIPMLGASGAIAGVLGVFAVRFYRTKIRIFWYLWTFSAPAIILLGIWLLDQVLQAVGSIGNPKSSGVAYWSHIGGILFGVVLAYALRMGREGSKEYQIADAQSNLDHGIALDAAEGLRSLLDHDPDNPDVHGVLARTYAMQGNGIRAIAHYRKSIEEYICRQADDRAVACYSEFKHYCGDERLDLKTEYRLARHMLNAGNHKAALQMLEDIASAYPDTPEAEVALMKAGDLYLNVFGDPRNALIQYERIVRDYPCGSCRSMVEKSISKAKLRVQE
jgi:membrane associated rhomboid family serine protease